MAKIIMKQVVALQPMEYNGGADIHTLACGGSHTAVGGYALKEAAAHGDPRLEQAPGRSFGVGGHLAASQD